MTRLTIIATAAFLASTGPSLAGEVVEYDRAKLDNPAYVEALREEIESAAEKECRTLFRGDMFRHFRIRSCIRDSVAVAMAELDAAKQTRFAEAAS